MRPSEISLGTFLQVGDVTQNGRGGKTASRSVKGTPLRITLRNCTTPFEVSSYDRVSDRKSLDVRADEETIAFVDRLDTELKQYAGNVGCPESGYTSLLKTQKEGYTPLFRQQITIFPGGKSPCKFFEAGTKRRLTDEEVAGLPWRDVEMNIMCKVTSLWTNAGRFGASATPEAIMVKRCDECPFTDADADCFD
jgi:hypothetical protein